VGFFRIISFMTPPLFDLTGRVALVTGGNKGLGKAMARGLAQAGADLVIASRNADQLEAALADILAGTGRKGVCIPCDVQDRAAVAKLGAEAVARMGKVDILINNAGQNAPQAIDQIDDATWDRVLEVNLSSVMALTRAVVPGMKERKWGRVIHIASIMAQVSKEGRNVYSATKSALMGLCRASALDLGPFNVTVNCIAPGPFLTDMPMSVLSDAEKKVFSDRTALGRWGQPEELAGPAVFLASEAGRYVTGQTLFVDGGYLAR
jgi:NAD(P)-dependent dehydrogenase (short-subunit alcohol dehydrogenase family)